MASCKEHGEVDATLCISFFEMEIVSLVPQIAIEYDHPVLFVRNCHILLQLCLSGRSLYAFGSVEIFPLTARLSLCLVNHKSTCDT